MYSSVEVHVAAVRDKTAVALLISKSADINIRDRNKRTPLHYAAKFSKTDIAELLISKGADLNIRDIDSNTPFYLAGEIKNLDTAALLISNGADINNQRHYTAAYWIQLIRQQKLCTSVENGDIQKVKDCFDLGADVNYADKYKNTPLHRAAISGQTDIIELLISKGANINTVNENGMTPVHLAAERNHFQTASILISKGSDLKIENRYRQTAEAFVKKMKLQKLKEQEQVLKELRDLGMETVDDFKDIMKKGTYKCFWNRIYLVGPYCVGKSTLARILVGEPTPIEWKSTDGIWIYIGRAGMDVDLQIWKFLPKERPAVTDYALEGVAIGQKVVVNGTAVREILESLLMSVRNEGAPNMISGNDNTTTYSQESEISVADQSIKLKPYTLPKKSIISTTDVNKRKRLTDHKLTHKVKIPNNDAKYKNDVKDVFIPQTSAMSSVERTHTKKIKDECRPVLGSTKTSKDWDSIKHYFTSMTNTNIHNLVIQAIKEGKYKQKIIPIDIWDFGGQKDYYMTHQLFITSRGIYVLMFNGSVDIHKIMNDLSFLPGHFGKPTVAEKNLKHGTFVYLLHWVNSILTYCKRTDDGFPKIIFVATHKDKIQKSKIEFQRNKLMDSIYELFKSHAGFKHLEFRPLIFINAMDKNDVEIDVIQRQLIEKTVRHPRWGEQMPTAWLPLELQLAEKVAEGTNIVTWEELQLLNRLNAPMVLNEKQLDTFLKVQHSLGKLLYFDEAKLRNFIIINPAYMVEVLRSIVTEKQFWPKGEEYNRVLKQLQTTGKIRRDDIHLLWSQKHFQQILPHEEYMVEMLVHLDIFVAPRTTFENVTHSTTAPNNMRNSDFLVPCMITESNSTRYIQDFCVPTKTLILAYTFVEELIPPAMTYRFLGSFMTMWDVKIYNGKSMLFSDLAVVEIDKNHDVAVQVQGNRVVVSLVHCNKKEDIVPTLASSVQECLTASINRISEFYSTLSGDIVAPKENEKLLKTANSTLPFHIDFGVLCYKGFFQKTWSICFFAQKELTQSSWTCPVHDKKHDVQSLRLWFTEKIPLERCLDPCTGLGKLELGVRPLDKHLCRFVRMLGISTFRNLFIHLGFTLDEWEQIEYQFEKQNPVNMMLTALIRWKEKQQTPTFGLLQKSLNECGEDVHKLCQVFRDITPDTPELTEETLSKKPTYEALQCLIHHIGDNVMELGVELDLDFVEIVRIQYEYKNKLLDQARAVLKHWADQTRENATVRTIVKALHRIGKISCISEVKF